MAECQLVQVGDGMTHQCRRHFRLTAGEMVIQRGFAQTRCAGQIGQGGAVVAAGNEDASQLVDQCFFGCGWWAQFKSAFLLKRYTLRGRLLCAMAFLTHVV